MIKNNIVLIGFMGVGKGTVARALAKQTNCFAIDTDDLIQSLENKKIKNIFKEFGELYFRQLEEKCSIWCEKNISNTIISTGGGFYKQKNLNKIGTIIYLQSTFDTILQGIYNAPNSIKKLKKRPLLNDKAEARRIYNLRVKEYEDVADIVINVEDQDINNSVRKILEEVKII